MADIPKIKKVITADHQASKINRETITKANQKVTRKMQWFLYINGLVISDTLMINFAFWLAYYIRFRLNIPVFQVEVVPSLSYYRWLIITLVPIWLGLFAFNGLYNRENLLGGVKEYTDLFSSVTLGFVIVISVGFLWEAFLIARGWLLLSWALSFCLTGIARFLARRLIYMLRNYGYFMSPALIVGANEEGISLADQLVQWKTSGFLVIGFIDKKFKPGEHIRNGFFCLGGPEDLDQVIKRHDVEELILATSAISSHDLQFEIFKQYGINGNVNVRFSSGLYEIITTGVKVQHFAYVPLMTVNPVRLTGMENWFKLILDYSLTIPGVILISPILLLLALMVKLDSPGPVIHRRRVIGVNGQEFDAFKFRTMYINGNEILEAMPQMKAELEKNHKLKDDPRITRVGKFLRKFSLDELLQVFNVLNGTMSLVGPRMISPGEIEEYKKFNINLLTVKPGITGLWQVSGRSDITYEERVRLDMYYIRNWNIFLDLQLLLQTFPAVIKGKGAY